MIFFIMPKTIYIGDECELYIKLSDLKINLEKFSAMKLDSTSIEGEDFSILYMDIVHINNDDFCLIRFKAWTTGEISLPDLQNYGIESRLPDIKVESLLEDNSRMILQEKKEGLLIPGTIFFLSTIFVSCILVILSIFLIYKKIKVLHIGTNKNKILKNFSSSTKKKLKQLKKNINNNKLISLETDLRLFLSKFFSCFNEQNIFALTYDEILDDILKNEIDKKQIDALKKIFMHFENTRFNKMDMDLRALSESYETFLVECKLEL